jgi:hypothetical protein
MTTSRRPPSQIDHHEPELDDAAIKAKKSYPTQLRALKDLFGATWTEQDLLATLEEVKGDLDLATNRILEGWFQTNFGQMNYLMCGLLFVHRSSLFPPLLLLGDASQWGEVKAKKREAPKPKAAESTFAPASEREFEPARIPRGGKILPVSKREATRW